MRIYRGKHIASIYRDILNDLLNNPEYISNPRGMQVREIINCIIEVEEPNMNMYKNAARSSQEKYIAAELLWYFSGTKKASFIEKYASMWSKLKDSNGYVNSAYGYLIFEEKNEHNYTQYRWAIESLIRDRDSRQAIMHFNKPYHQYIDNPDQVCTLTSLFHIRDNKLHMTLNMRSNDVILGFMTDFTFFNILHQQAYLHLKEHYLDLEMGTYTHTSHSMHLYSKNYKKVEEMLKEEFIPYSTPLLNTSIRYESSRLKADYANLLIPVMYDGKFNKKVEYTDNDILNWCIDKLKT